MRAIAAFVFLLSLDVTVHAAPSIDAVALQAYLQSHASPLASVAQDIYEASRRNDIDPRLLIAIAGQETSYGNHVCTPFNAWNMFYTHIWCDAPYVSWSEGVFDAAFRLHDYYLYNPQDPKDTIEKIGNKYCERECLTCPKGCPVWIQKVSRLYQEMGGCLNDLSFGEPDPGKCTNSKPPEPSCSISTLASVNFGNVKVGECSDTVLIPVQSGIGCKKNTVTTSTSLPFIILSSETLTLQGAESKNVQVRFCPTAIESVHGQLVVTGEHAPQPVELGGNGIDPTINPDSQCFFDTSGEPWDEWNCAVLFYPEEGVCAKEVYMPGFSPETVCALAKAVFPRGVNYYQGHCPTPFCGPFIKECSFGRLYGIAPIDSVPCN